MSKYKRVVIFGPDHNGAFEGEILEAQKFTDCLVIGDGKRDVSLSEIETALEGKIDEGTRIDLCAHGGNDSVVGDVHYLCLANNSDTLTGDFFVCLARAAEGKAVYTHLWNCFAGNATADFSDLPEGSIAVMHSSKNVWSIGNFLAMRYQDYDGSIEGAKKDVARDLSSIIALGGSINFKKSGKRYGVRYSIAELGETQSYLTTLVNYLASDHEALVSSSSDVEEDIARLSASISELFMLPDLRADAVLDEAELKEKRDYFVGRLYIGNNNLTKFRELIARDDYNVNAHWGSNGQNLLEYTIRNGATEFTNELAKEIVKRDKRDKNGDKPLMSAVKRCNKDALKALIAAGADLYAKDINGETALMVAAKHGYIEVIEILIQAGADVNARSNAGWTALHFIAAGFGSGDSKAVTQKLIDLGADKEGFTPLGLSPLNLSVYHKNIAGAKVLLESGVKVYSTNYFGYCSMDFVHNSRQADLRDEFAKYGVASQAEKQGKSPVDWLAAEYANDPAGFMCGIADLKHRNIQIEEEKVSEFLSKVIKVGKGQTTNLRKIIKNARLDDIEQALRFAKKITASDVALIKDCGYIEIATRASTRVERPIMKLADSESDSFIAGTRRTDDSRSGSISR